MASFDSILTATILGKPALLWLAFMAIVVALLAFDIGVLGRRRGRAGAGQGMTAAESLWLSAFYIGAGLAFGGWVWWSMGADSGLDYFTDFLVEKSLSLDNVFVIALIFSTRAIPPAYQHRVLFWGILGAIALRAMMIAAGAALVSNFSWVLYLFGAFLVATGVKMLWLGDREPDIAGNPLLRLMRRYMRVTDRLHGQHFLVRLPDPGSGRNLWHATPLLLAGPMINESPREACDRLMNAVIPFAEEMLTKHGEFYPYGGALGPDGEVVSIGVTGDDEHPLSADVIRDWT